MNTQHQATIVYFSHGGGPLPLLGDPGHQAMVDFMTDLPTRIPKPEAILVISAHWEERVPTLQGAPRPPMLYDYYGFPPETYEIKYPAPGNPALAEQIAGMLDEAGLGARIDQRRGFDHGLFIPLNLMYPQADIPAMQLSLMKNLSPQAHLALGKALQGLRDKPLLVIGSGFSFHNMAAYFHHTPEVIHPRNDPFQNWLMETITGELTPKERIQRLSDWESAPYARYCHPREEHLLPLHVCAGMAEGTGEVIFDDRILGARALAFKW